MYRREFIKSSGLVLGAAVVGLPSLLKAIEPEVPESFESSRPRLRGQRRLGCARSLADPVIALQLPSEFSAQFA